MTTNINTSDIFDRLGDHFQHHRNRYHRLSKLMILAILIALTGNYLLQIGGANTADAANLNAEPYSNGGLFYDRKTIRIGQTESMNSIVAYLRECGYSEVDKNKESFSAGSFRIRDESSLHLRSNFPDVAKEIEVKWDGNRIKSIDSEGLSVESTDLEPKPVANLAFEIQEGDESTNVVSFQVKYVPIRNFELEGTPLQNVVCITEGGCRGVVSVYGIGRAFVRNVQKKLGLYDGSYQGGSTGCAQLVKVVIGDRSQSVMRKIEEVYACSDLRRRMSGLELRQLYANNVYLGVSHRGRNLFGFEAASLDIFQKHARNLDEKEAVFIAALIPEPKLLAKLSSRKRNDNAWRLIEAKMNTIIANLAETDPKRFTPELVGRIKSKKLKFAWDTETKKQPPTERPEPYLLQYAAAESSTFKAKQVADELTVAFSDLRVLRGETTIDEKLQRVGRSILQKRIKEIRAAFPPVDENTGKATRDALIGVAMASDPATGAILAMNVASSDPTLELSKMYIDHGVDPASQIKPIVLVCSLGSRKVTLSTVVQPSDGYVRQLNGNRWQPTRGVGDVPKTILQALADSDDGVATYIAGNVLGIDEAVQCYGKATGNFAEPNVGPNGRSEYSPLNAIGFGVGLGTSPVEMLEAYSAIVNNGGKTKLRLLSSVYSGSVRLDRGKSVTQEEILDPGASYLAFRAMQGVVGVGPMGAYGTMTDLPFAKYLQEHPDRPMGCKTGSGKRNVGVVCISPRLAVTVQLYYARNSVFKQVGGSDIYAARTAGSIWSNMMSEYVKVRPDLFEPSQLSIPAGVSQVNVDLANSCSTPTGTIVPYISGTEPASCGEQHQVTSQMIVDTLDDSGTYLRGGPSVDEEKVSFVPEGSTVNLLRCETELAYLAGRAGRWCEVGYGESQGFVWGWWLRRVNEGPAQ